METIQNKISLKWDELKESLRQMKLSFSGLPTAIEFMEKDSRLNATLISQNNPSAYYCLKTQPKSTRFVMDEMATYCENIGTPLQQEIFTANTHDLKYRISSISLVFNDLKAYLYLINLKNDAPWSMIGDNVQIARQKIDQILMHNSKMLECTDQITCLISIIDK